jgi:hypothetical protein
MIRYVRHHEINKKKWDDCIETAGYSIAYAYSWYLDVVSPSWDALIDEDYVAVLPLTWKSKYGLYYLTQPVYAQQLGAFSKQPVTGLKLKQFLNAIPKKFLHYDINMNPLNNEHSLCFKFRFTLCKTYHLSLRPNYNLIASAYSNDTKRNISIIKKHPLILKPIDVETVTRLYKRNVWHKTPGLKISDFKRLKILIEEVAKRNKVMMLGAYENDLLSAGSIFFICGDKIIFIFGAANNRGRKNGAMRFIFDQVIRDHCNSGLLLDFEGSSVKSVEYFYKSFGSEMVPFFNVSFSRFSLLKNLIEKKQLVTKMIARQKIKKLNASESPDEY